MDCKVNDIEIAHVLSDLDDDVQTSSDDGSDVESAARCLWAVTDSPIKPLKSSSIGKVAGPECSPDKKLSSQKKTCRSLSKELDRSSYHERLRFNQQMVKPLRLKRKLTSSYNDKFSPVKKARHQTASEEILNQQRMKSPISNPYRKQFTNKRLSEVTPRRVLSQMNPVSPTSSPERGSPSSLNMLVESKASYETETDQPVNKLRVRKSQKHVKCSIEDEIVPIDDKKTPRSVKHPKYESPHSICSSPRAKQLFLNKTLCSEEVISIERNTSTSSRHSSRSRTPTSSLKIAQLDNVNTELCTIEEYAPAAVITPRCGKMTPQSVRSTPSKIGINMQSPISLKRSSRGFLTPRMPERASPQVATPSSELNLARLQLHISTIPESLPCREKEFDNICRFIQRKIHDGAGGCMYISGVPGTGKTATVHAVIRSLQHSADIKEISKFDFVEVNGLRLTEPRQAYVRILQELTGQHITAEQAQRVLEKRFISKARKATIFLVDELDYLCNRRQDVIYNILDWTTKSKARLIVLTIANTMDLPERTLKGRVTSRMGLTRLVFQPYTHQQLQEIVLNRLAGNTTFHPDAIQLVARKVAAVSGDARRALDICRRATELIDDGQVVTVQDVEEALNQIFSGPRVRAIRSCCLMAQGVLRSLRDETQRTGMEETTVAYLYQHLSKICTLEGWPHPSVGQVLALCTSLANSGLIVAEKGRPDLHRKLSLNVSSDDIHYALSC